MTSVATPNAKGTYPTEPKVKASTAASYALALLTTALMTIVQDENMPLLVGFLPEVLEPFVLALIPALATFVAGYFAPHQQRLREGLGGGTTSL